MGLRGGRRRMVDEGAQVPDMGHRSPLPPGCVSPLTSTIGPSTTTHQDPPGPTPEPTAGPTRSDQHPPAPTRTRQNPPGPAGPPLVTDATLAAQAITLGRVGGEARYTR